MLRGGAEDGKGGRIESFPARGRGRAGERPPATRPATGKEEGGPAARPLVAPPRVGGGVPWLSFGRYCVRRPASPAADTSKPIHIPVAACAGT